MRKRMLAINEYQGIAWGQNLYRIGVLRDGSCFFHSLLMETDPVYYTLSLKSKTDAVVDLRRKIASSLSINDFHTMSSHGTPLHKDLPEQVKRYHKETYNVSPQEVAQLTAALETYAYEMATPSVDEIKTTLRHFLSFRDYIRNPQESVGDELHLLVSRVLDVDVYLTTTQEDGTMGYVLHDPSLAYQGRRSVILHKVPGKDHWEAVGKLSDNGLIMLFEPDADVILQLRKCFEDHWARLQS